jgi:hypothetical protein
MLDTLKRLHGTEPDTTLIRQARGLSCEVGHGR